MAQQVTYVNSAPTGVVAQYFGSPGTTDRWYWIQAIYTGGLSALTGAPKVTTGGLNNNNRVSIEWNSMAGAIGYNVFYTTTSTAPSSGSILLGTVTYPTFVDQGISTTPSTATVTIGGNGLLTARGHYSFATDGGAIATITLAVSDTIPLGAIMVGGYAFVNTALTSGGSATISIGTSAGSSAAALKAATAVASYSLAAVLPLVPTFAVPVRMTAAGTLTITVAVATLLTGEMDIVVYFN